jgi:hypothetical protein
MVPSLPSTCVNRLIKGEFMISLVEFKNQPFFPGWEARPRAQRCQLIQNKSSRHMAAPLPTCVNRRRPGVGC